MRHMYREMNRQFLTLGVLFTNEISKMEVKKTSSFQSIDGTMFQGSCITARSVNELLYTSSRTFVILGSPGLSLSILAQLAPAAALLQRSYKFEASSV